MQYIAYWGPQSPGGGAPNHLAPALIELTGFKSLFLVRFQASALDQSQHLLVKCSWKSAC